MFGNPSLSRRICPNACAGNAASERIMRFLPHSTPKFANESANLLPSRYEWLIIGWNLSHSLITSCHQGNAVQGGFDLLTIISTIILESISTIEGLQFKTSLRIGFIQGPVSKALNSARKLDPLPKKE